MTVEHRPIEKRLLLLLGTLLAMNPVILFLLTRSLLVTIGTVIAAVAIPQVAYTYRSSILPTVYSANALAVAGLFLHAEVIFVNAFPDYVIEDLYTLERGYYFNKPDLVSQIESREYSALYLTNEEGFRIGYSQHTDVTFDSVDVLVIGDSFTQGAQVDFEDLYTTRLYRSHPTRIVANAGISGLGLPEELALYRDRGSRLRPDVVVLQLSAFNDFMNVEPNRIGVSDLLAHYSSFIRFLLQDLKYANPASLPLGRWTEPFYPTVDENLRLNVFYRDSSEQKDRDLENFVRYLGMFADEVRADGAELVVLLLPTKEQVRFRYLDEVVTAFDIPLEDLDLEAPNRILAEAADSLGVTLLDLWASFGESTIEPYFEYDEHLSPEGHLLLASELGNLLSGMLAAESRVEILSQEYSGDRYPSPDTGGQSIYYHSWVSGNTELFVADSLLQGTGLLTLNDVDEAHPSPSPSASLVAFTEGDASTGRTEVALLDTSTLVRQHLTSLPGEYGAIPSFDPSGRRIAFAQWFDGGDSLSLPRIAVADLETDERLLLTNEGIETWRPVFSPDGNELAYIRREDGQFDLFMVELATNTHRRLTNTSYDEWDPRFSQDGRRLVYSAHRDGNWDLFILELASGGVTRLTATKGDEWDPSFLPHGEAVLYAGEYGIFRGIYRLSLP